MNTKNTKIGKKVIKSVVEKPGSREEAKAFFERLRQRLERRERPSKFMPYVLIRSCAGDNGTRPLPAGSPPFWESPDIWTWAGDPSVAPEIPPNQGGTVSVGGIYTIYAHVWNLGRAPIAGATVEWFWFHPFLGIDSSHANPIGRARVDLAPRGFPGCHKLVKCHEPYVVQPLVNDDHPCLVSRISAFGDPLNSSHEWDAWADRHIAQKNLTVLNANDDAQRLLRSLEGTKPPNATVRLYQVGLEAAQALALAAPHLEMDPAVKTTLLAELSPEGKLTLPPLTPGIRRIMPNLLLNLGSKPAVPSTLTKKRVRVDRSNLLYERADVTTLMYHGTLLPPELAKRVETLPLPKKGQAQVLRIVAYKDNKPVGGYTIVVSGNK